LLDNTLVDGELNGLRGRTRSKVAIGRVNRLYKEQRLGYLLHPSFESFLPAIEVHASLSCRVNTRLILMPIANSRVGVHWDSGGEHSSSDSDRYMLRGLQPS
jgi:hypothetical protein